MQKSLNIVCGVCVVAAVLGILILGCCPRTQNSGVAKVETEVVENTGPMSQNAWTEAVRKATSAYGVYSIIRVVEASDGHDYVVGWLYKEQIIILHAAGCRKCAGIAEKASQSTPLPSSFN